MPEEVVGVDVEERPLLGVELQHGDGLPQADILLGPAAAGGCNRVRNYLVLGIQIWIYSVADLKLCFLIQILPARSLRIQIQIRLYR